MGISNRSRSEIVLQNGWQTIQLKALFHYKQRGLWWQVNLIEEVAVQRSHQELGVFSERDYSLRKNQVYGFTHITLDFFQFALSNNHKGRLERLATAPIWILIRWRFFWAGMFVFRFFRNFLRSSRSIWATALFWPLGNHSIVIRNRCSYALGVPINFIFLLNNHFKQWSRDPSISKLLLHKSCCLSRFSWKI